MNRNRAASAVSSVAILVLFAACGNDQPTAQPTSTQTTSADTTDAPSGADLASAAASAKSCGYTPSSTEGPYYVSGTQELAGGNLNYDDLEGEPIKVVGYVYGSDQNSDPVADAKIEIWHTDADGAYHPQNNGPVSNYSDEEISLRGYVTSDDDGYYEFTSIFPGEYEGRTRHIHVRVSADGHEPLVSQIITALPGDRFPPEGDMIARSFPKCNLVDFTERDGTKTAVFNFHIR